MLSFHSGRVHTVRFTQPLTKNQTVYLSWEPFKLTLIFITSVVTGSMLLCILFVTRFPYLCSGMCLLFLLRPLFKGDSNLNDNLSPSEIDWMMSEWLREQRSPPGNDGPVTTGTKGVMSKRRKWERRRKSQRENKSKRMTTAQSEMAAGTISASWGNTDE